jgi:ABC-type uncharacterized transport system substrate-binding protein
VDDQGLRGVFVNWTFDQMFSAFIKKEYDLDKNNELSRSEQTALYNTAFRDLAKNNYFAVISADGKPVPIPQPEQFSARLVKETDMASYSFFLPIVLPAEKTMRSCELAFFDPVIYVAFTITEKDMGMQNRSRDIDASLVMNTVKHMKRPMISFKKRSE